MTHFKSVLFFSFLLLISCSQNNNKLSLQTDSLNLIIDNTGSITSFTDISSGKNYIAEDASAPLMSIQLNGDVSHPHNAGFIDNNTITLDYQNGIRAEIKYTKNKSHINFELISISDSVDLIIWGPYPTTITKIIGETIGVVRGDDFALGIQALNPRTLGGYPWNENDCMPQIDIFEQDDMTDLSEEGKRYVLYRVEAAIPTEYGSSLQAYCRNRDKERIIENWGHERYTAPAFDDGGVTGSKIALFGCPVESTLETMGKIEIAENLPHPMIDGEWVKTAISASAAYIIMNFGEKDIDRAIEITRKAGLRYLDHSGPFENWGHFQLRKERFPNGIESMKNCVAKAMSQNVMLGVHTLSNFITTNDPYVSPVPDKRLAKVGSSIITENIDAKQTEILIQSPDFFNQFKNNHLKTIQIENELIRYAGITKSAPWKLLDCQRGVHGTKAASHSMDENIYKLADHAYKVFLTNSELSIELGKNIADFFNQTGVRQISFDGLEGNRSTGMGNYGEILFTQAWYDNLNDDIRQHYIADASRTSHYFWHMYSRMNWGEPWYAGFRESQTEYRMKNQAYFTRNLMPAMLGWFRISSSTSIEDTEWMLAKSGAYNAGYAFVVDYKSLEENGCSDEILSLLGEWEKVRMADAFTEEQRHRMKNMDNEFHLEVISSDEWKLYQVTSHKFTYKKKEKQPGEPIYANYTFDNPNEEQSMNFIITAAAGGLDKIHMEIDNYKNITLDISLKEGQSIKYTGGSSAIIYDKTLQQIGSITIDEVALKLSQGSHSINFECSFTAVNDAEAKIELRFIGQPEKIKI